jgi:hypothetical protein
MRYFEPLAQHPLFESHELFYEHTRIIFTQEGANLHLLIPPISNDTLKWNFYGKNFDDLYSHDEDEFDLLPNEFQDIIKEAVSLLEKRDRIRQLFKKEEVL